MKIEIEVGAYAAWSIVVMAGCATLATVAHSCTSSVERKCDPMTSEQQLELWVKGDPRCPNDQGECCPDFSCCRRELLLPLAERERFVAEPSRREEMMMGALAKSLSLEGQVATVLAAPTSGSCSLCGRVEELRPYGSNGEHICCECGRLDPKTTEQRMAERLGLAGDPSC